MAETELVKEQVEELTAEAPETSEAPAKAVAKKRKKVKRNVPTGQVHILSTFNNTLISFTDPKGNVLSSSSAGANGFRGSKKGTAYAAQVAAENAAQVAKSQFGLTKAEVFVKGVGLGRDSAVRAVANLDIQIESLTDVTGVPHGGVRPKKARRV
ncbi:MAG TPA: 30S ribosomal protein S11 [Candidatus Saccharimonadales bacterium]|jgi:small subunit ribosomal protein S11